MTEVEDWWDNLLAQHRLSGAADCRAGIYEPPYPGSDDPTDEDENRAYKQGWTEQRKALGEKFRWK